MFELVLVLFSFFSFKGLSSKSILTDGVKSSSYCPFLTAHKKAIKKPTATTKLIPINTNIALTVNDFGSNVFLLIVVIYDTNHLKT